MRLLRWLVGVTVFGLPRLALASDLSGLETYATIESAGVRVTVNGDDDHDAVVYAEIRKKGAATFERGHRLLPVDFETTGAFVPGLHIGSSFFLESDTDYDVRVVLEDPDNAAPVELGGNVHTRSGTPAAPTGKTLHVSSSGNDASDGSSLEKALKTLGKGLSLAAPGDRVLVEPGTYHESFAASVSGAPGAPIWLSANGAGVIIDGSDPALAGATWTDEGSGVWSTPNAFAGDKQYLAVDGKRLYGFSSLAELTAGATGIGDAFYLGGGKLYVKLASGANPSSHDVRLAKEQRLLFDHLHDLVIDGFEIRYFWDAAIDLPDTSRSFVQNNHIHHCRSAVRIRRAGATENVVQKNQLVDDSVYEWPWNQVKSHDEEGSGVAISGGRGNVVRDNVIDGFFNGVGASGWPDFDPEIASETDVTRNLIRNTGDDAFEPDGPAVNQRFVGNFVDRVYNALSYSPLNPGPVWAIRNVIAGYTHHIVKLNYLSSPPVELRGWMLVYHNTGVPGAGADADDATYIEPTAQFEHLVTRNNIFAANGYSILYEAGPNLLGPIDLDYDDLVSSHKTSPKLVKWSPSVRYDTLADFAAATGYEKHGVEIAPSFVDVAQGDYTLAAGSPLLDVGEVLPGINDKWHVDGPDLGAVERGLGGGPGPGGAGGFGGGGAGGTTGGGATGNSGGSSAGSSGGARGSGEDDDAGCGCRAADSESRASVAWLFVLSVASACVRRARRRASAHTSERG